MFFLALLLISSVFASNPTLSNAQIAQREVIKENFYNTFLESLMTGDLTEQIHLANHCYIECKAQQRLVLLAVETLIDEPEYQASVAQFLNHVDITQFQVQVSVPPKTPLRPEQVNAIFNYKPPLQVFENGAYANSIRLFMFCRESREFPCMMVLKNKYDQVVYHNQTMWTQPSLAFTRNGNPYYKTAGVTPQGILLIDGVMPTANRPDAFGKFRRIILNFVNPSNNEVLYRSLLPPSHEPLSWWKEAVVARDVGRDLLRIHGTGKLNTQPRSTYYPFLPTMGCISKRENTYSNISYIDQRLMLDELMLAMDLQPSFVNEVNIKGLLYVVEIDDVQAAVTMQDLARYGIR